MKQQVASSRLRVASVQSAYSLLFTLDIANLRPFSPDKTGSLKAASLPISNFCLFPPVFCPFRGTAATVLRLSKYEQQ